MTSEVVQGLTLRELLQGREIFPEAGFYHVGLGLTILFTGAVSVPSALGKLGDLALEYYD